MVEPNKMYIIFILAPDTAIGLMVDNISKGTSFLKHNTNHIGISTLLYPKLYQCNPICNSMLTAMCITKRK